LNSSKQDILVDGRLRTAWLLVVAGICGLNWIYLGLEFYRHWSTLRVDSRFIASLLLLAYPIPCLHLFKKEPNPFVITMLLYMLLCAAGFIMFPLLP
jgi:cytochrome bd-type quinol oxidase subunit 2